MILVILMNLRIMPALNEIKLWALLLWGIAVFNSVLGLIPFINTIVCLLSPLTMILNIGVLIYIGYLLASKMFKLEDIAITAGLVGFVGGLISAILGIILNLLGLATRVAGSGLSGGNMGSAAMAGATSAGMGTVCALGGTVIAFIIGAVLGIIGYFVYDFMKKKK